MDPKGSRMKRAHIRCRKQGLNNAEEHESHHDSHRHSRNPRCKKVSRSRCHAESSILKHHPVGKTEPDVYHKIHVIYIRLVVGETDKDDNACNNKRPDLTFCVIFLISHLYPLLLSCP